MINLIGFAAYSQNSDFTDSNQMEFYQLQEEFQGKFQIQMVGTRAKPAIPQNLLQEIRDRQKQSERVYFDFTSKVRIMILSKDEVGNGFLIPEEESIIYIN